MFSKVQGMIDNISYIQHCYQLWLDSISKLDDFSIIEKLTKGHNECFIEEAKSFIRHFNYTKNWIAVNFELPESEWGHRWDITVISPR